MKKILIVGTICLIVGGATGWLISTCRNYDDFGVSLRLIKEGELVEKIEQCEKAYFPHNWDIAAWELENLKDTLDSYSTNGFLDTNYLNFQFFVVNARLAKVYGELGDKTKSQAYIESAMKYKRWSGAVPESL